MKLKSLAAAMTLAIVGLGSAGAAPVLSIVPAQNQVSIGGTIRVAIVISGLDSANEIVSGFDLNVAFNTAALSSSGIDVSTATAVMGGSNTLFGFDSDASDSKIGSDLTSFLTDLELDGLQGDSFTLMLLDFTGLADGVSYLDFGADPNLERLVTGRLDSSGFAGVLNLQYTGACVAVGTGSCTQNPIPEPATFGLAGLALLGCGLTRSLTRRRRAPMV
ncbi:PEP-CTERM sorting domain-containing protein [Rubrivivax rivuli]|uniref:PEP-CTERM sorting domain-containing protein n=1 Tax=Rubrivivax rivuli TaxID=1862385 RepID=A0A437RAL5_9BURK|nr:PEP-CTERM sorting domain-containing protein [Rubrivivax rivuli]RVU43840.1 PEP-CTERM sorting domain-containing protein [Rubrivivax rivuli]